MRNLRLLTTLLLAAACTSGGSTESTPPSSPPPAPPPPPPPPPAVSTVVVTPGGATTFAPGAQVQLSAVLRDASNNVLTGRFVNWTTSAGTVATVSSAGLVTGVAAGTAAITAANGTITGNAVITISPTAIAPFLQRPFTGEYLVLNPMDHDTPEEFIDNNGHLITTSGETAPGFDGHAGYDFMMPVGTPIFAAAAGTVNVAGSQTFFCPPLGQNVAQLGIQIQHLVAGNPEYWTYYAHASRVDVAVGQHVEAGQQIGLSGNTGCTTAPHLHFQLDRLAGTNNGQLTIVDPYGWNGTGADPWELKPNGAKSVNVWLPGQAPSALLGMDAVLAPLNNTNSTPTPKAVGISAVRFMGEHDELNPNNEYVEIKIDPAVYTGPTYAMTGHYIKNNAGVRFDFPAGFTIAQGQTVRLYVGSGTPNATTLYWGRPAGIFANAGDCAQLFFPNASYYLLGWVTTCQ